MSSATVGFTGCLVALESVTSVPSCLGAAYAVGLDLLLVPAGEVRRHRVGRQAALFAPAGQVTSYVGVERVHEDLVGGEHVAGGAGRLERIEVEEQRTRRHL